jgi:hypothetical protein
MAKKRVTLVRRSTLVAMTLLGLAGAAIHWADRASAISPETHGWWWQGNGGALLGSPVPTAAADVPPGGMLIEGGPGSTPGPKDSCDSLMTSPGSACSAYGAITYVLPSGTTAATLSLTIASQSTSTPNTTLELCPLHDAQFKAEQGGPLSDGPRLGCVVNVTSGTSQTQPTFQFPVASLISGNHLAVAVLPTSPTDRVVLAPPGSTSLEVLPSPATPATAPSNAAPGLPPSSPGSLPSTTSASSQQVPVSGMPPNLPTSGSNVGTNQVPPELSPTASSVGRSAAPAFANSSYGAPQTADLTGVYLILVLAAGALGTSAFIFKQIGVKSLWTS